MMKSRQIRFILIVLSVLVMAVPVFSQDEKKYYAASLDGTTGLFRTWDAETLRQGEFNFTFAWNRYNRDPGELKFDTIPVGAAYGLHDRLEIFSSFDVLKRIDPRSISFYRVLPGQLPVPATSLRGATTFNNEAPFVDVPVATGIGDVRIGGKFNVLSERRGNPFSMGIVGFVKISTANSITALNRGLGSGEVDGGFGTLFSKTAGRFGRFHLNTMVNFVGDPIKQGVQLADLQNEFWYRGGASIPAYGEVHFIAEVDGKINFGDRTLGANPRSPVDFIFGLRYFPREWISVGAGYRASINHLDEDAAIQRYPADTHGFVAQLAVGRRINLPPTISCAVANASIKQDETTTIRANAADPDGDTLTFTWTSTGGRVTGSGDTATFDATGVAPGKYTVTATVSDGKHEASCSTEITVIKKNLPPTAVCEPTSRTITVGESTTVQVRATDPNNDSLTYTWTVNGQRLAADGPSITFGTEGRQPGNYSIAVTASDGELSASCTSTITVQPKANRPPTISCLTSNVDVASGGTVGLQVQTSDPDNDPTTVSWSSTAGVVTGSGNNASFSAEGLKAGSYTVTAEVTDGRGGRASCSMTVNVSEKFVLPGDFAIGRARIDNKAKAALDDLAIRMQNEPRLRATLTGYTDNSRRETSSKGLGQKRAQAAADYLTQKKGIDAARLTVKDGGDTNPIGDNSTAAGRKQNRRVEIELTTRP